MTTLLISFTQCCDLGFHASLARTMRTYLSAEYSLETSRHEGLDLIEGAVDATDIRGDKLKFMDAHSQIFCPPARFDYQPHMGDEVSHRRRVALVKGLVCLQVLVLYYRFIPPCLLFLASNPHGSVALLPLSQVCQVSAQQPVQTELLMRYHQLQSRLATLKIENEEVRGSVGVVLQRTRQTHCAPVLFREEQMATFLKMHYCIFIILVIWPLHNI